MIQASLSPVVPAENGADNMSVLYCYRTGGGISLQEAHHVLSGIIYRTDSKALNLLPKPVYLIVIIRYHFPDDNTHGSAHNSYPSCRNTGIPFLFSLREYGDLL